MNMYAGVDIGDGKVTQEFYLEYDLPEKDQWFYLTPDIGGISYIFPNGWEFIVDIGYGKGAGFYVLILNGEETDGKIFFIRWVKSLKGLKELLSEAIEVVNHLKKLSNKELLDWPEFEREVIY